MVSVAKMVLLGVGVAGEAVVEMFRRVEREVVGWEVVTLVLIALCVVVLGGVVVEAAFRLRVRAASMLAIRF